MNTWRRLEPAKTLRQHFAPDRSQTLLPSGSCPGTAGSCHLFNADLLKASGCCFF